MIRHGFAEVSPEARTFPLARFVFILVPLSLPHHLFTFNVIQSIKSSSMSTASSNSAIQMEAVSESLIRVNCDPLEHSIGHVLAFHKTAYEICRAPRSLAASLVRLAAAIMQVTLRVLEAGRGPARVRLERTRLRSCDLVSMM
jgi:hypothetical protein